MKDGPPMSRGESRKLLYGGSEANSTARDVKALRQEKSHMLETPIPEGVDRKKYEVYALVTHALEQMYPEIEKNLNDQNRIPLISGGSGTMEEYSLKEDMLERGGTHIRSTIDELRNSCGIIVREVAEEWVLEMQQRSLQKDESYDVKVYERLLATFAEFDAQRNHEVESIETFIANGGGTAGHTSWDVMASIPIVYHRQFGTYLSQEEFRSIARNSEPLALALTSMHLNHFTAMRDEGAQSRTHATMNVEFGPDFFVLARDPKGNTSLEFDPEYLASWSSSRSEVFVDKSGERLGCPARDARVILDGKKTNMASAFYRYVEGHAQQFLAPYLTEYTNEVLGAQAQKTT